VLDQPFGSTSPKVRSNRWLLIVRTAVTAWAVVVPTFRYTTPGWSLRLALALDVSAFDPSAGVKPGQFQALFGGHREALGTLGRSYRSPRRSLRVPPDRRATLNALTASTAPTVPPISQGPRVAPWRHSDCRARLTDRGEHCRVRWSVRRKTARRPQTVTSCQRSGCVSVQVSALCHR
jgi:hypothetical protein